MSGGRYEASRSVVGALFVAVFGLALALPFLGLGVDAALDLAAFPPAPRAIAVAEAAAMADPPRGAWVRLADARVDCRFPARHGASGPDVYVFVTDASGGPRVLVATPSPGPACDDPAPPPFVGVLRAMAPGRVVGLSWPGLDWRAWPTPHLAVLWTSGGPGDAWGMIGVAVVMGLIGGLMAAGGLASAWGARAGAAPRPAPVAGPGFTLPLSTGASALSLFGAPLGVVQLVVFGPLFLLTHLPGWMALPLGVLAALWFFGVVGLVIDGWRRRASDLRLGADAVGVVGGPLHRARFAFRDVDGARFRLAPAATEDGDHATLLLDGEVAALCRDDDEARSLEAVADTLRALGAQARGEARPDRGERPPAVLACGGCGAPIAPTAAASARCRHCGEDAPMPDDVRASLADEAAIARARADTERLLRRLLRQPGARFVNAVLVAAVPPLLLGWPIAGVLFDEMFQVRQVFRWHHGVALFVAAVTFTHGLGWLLRSLVGARAAVRLVATRFAAVPPEAPGDPCACHACGAPLPDAGPEGLVARCAYCRADNVLGTGLAPVARREVGQAADLEATLREALARRGRHARAAIASLALLAVSVASLAPVWRALGE